MQQSRDAAADLDEKLFKLRNLSDTRFVAYFGDCLSNNEKSLKISIMVLKEKSTDLSSKKEVRDKAGRILKQWKTQQWMMVNLGLIDVFTVLGNTSKSLQKVEQFPWEILKTQNELIKTLRSMANIQLTDLTGERFEGNFDKDLWIKLNEDVEKVLSGEYKGQDTQVFQVFRRGRSSDDIRQSSLSLLKTVQNRLSSICKAIAGSLETRLENEDTHGSTQLIKSMGQCLDIQEMLEKGTDDEDFNERGLSTLADILDTAMYDG